MPPHGFHRVDACRAAAAAATPDPKTRARSGAKELLSPGSIVSVDDDVWMDGDSSTATGKGNKRRSLKTNNLRMAFPSSYRKPDNKNQLFGRTISLGKAFTVLLPAMFGVNVPTEKTQLALRERLFRSAAHYALSEDEVDIIFEADSKERELFLMGLVNASLAKIRYDMGEESRAHFQETVFCSIARNPIIQRELGFDAFQSLGDM